MSRIKSDKGTYWDNYEGPKCPYPTFIQRLCRGMKYEKAILPGKMHKGKGLRKYREEYEGEDKVSRNCFFRAIQLGYPKEVAIKRKLTLIEMYPEYYEFWKNYEGEKCSFSQFIMRRRVTTNLNKAIQPKKLTNVRSITHNEAKIIIPESYYLIEVTLKPEEAKVFHSTYRGIIDKLEEQIYGEEDLSTLQKLEAKLKQINKEYQTFLTFNPL